MVEHLLCKQGVVGSSPFASTRRGLELETIRCSKSPPHEFQRERALLDQGSRRCKEHGSRSRLPSGGCGPFFENEVSWETW